MYINILKKYFDINLLLEYTQKVTSKSQNVFEKRIKFKN